MSERYDLPGLSAEGPYVRSPDGRWLAAGSNRVDLWDLHARTMRHSFEADVTAQTTFTPDSTGLVIKTILTPQSGMEDHVTERTYDVHSGSLVDEKSWWERQ